MIAHIPDEIWLVIFDHLATSKLPTTNHHFTDYLVEERLKQETLARLCRTCKCFQHLADPILYSAFIKLDHDCKEVRPKAGVTGAQRPNRAFRSFLRTILERPYAAKMVKTIVLGSWETTHSLRALNMKPCPQQRDLSRLVRDNRLPLLMTCKEPCYNDLSSGDEDAEIALLLALLTNVENLAIAISNSLSSPGLRPHYHTVLARTVKLSRQDDLRHRPFSKLDHLSVFCRSNNVVTPFYPISDFLDLPLLKTFHGSGIFDYPSHWGPGACTPRKSAVDKIVLKDSLLSEGALTMLTNSCKSLREFSLSTGRMQHQLDISWVGAKKALAGQAQNLERLTLNLQPRAFLRGPVQSSLGDMSAFTALTTLAVHFHAIVDGKGAYQMDLVRFLRSLSPLVTRLIIYDVYALSAPQTLNIFLDGLCSLKRSSASTLSWLELIGTAEPGRGRLEKRLINTCHKKLTAVGITFMCMANPKQPSASALTYVRLHQVNDFLLEHVLQ